MFQVKKLVSHAIIPKRKTESSVGLDINSSVDIIIPSHKWLSVPTGISIKAPRDYYIKIAPINGIASKYGIQVSTEVIDSDFTDEIKVILFNYGENNFTIKTGDKIAQLIIEQILTDELVEVKEFTTIEMEDNYMNWS